MNEPTQLKHSPAPWTVEKSGDDWRVLDANGETVFDCSYVMYEGGGQPPKDIDSALILAAPEALAELEVILKRIETSDAWWMDCPNKGGFDTERIEAVINKMKGQP